MVFPKSANPMGVLSRFNLVCVIAFNPTSCKRVVGKGNVLGHCRNLGQIPVLVAWTLRKKKITIRLMGTDSLEFVENIHKNDVSKTQSWIMNPIDCIDCLE